MLVALSSTSLTLLPPTSGISQPALEPERPERPILGFAGEGRNLAQGLEVEEALRGLRSHRARIGGLLHRPRPTRRPGVRSGSHGSCYRVTAHVVYCSDMATHPNMQTQSHMVPKTYAGTLISMAALCVAIKLFNFYKDRKWVILRVWAT